MNCDEIFMIIIVEEYVEFDDVYVVNCNWWIICL